MGSPSKAKARSDGAVAERYRAVVMGAPIIMWSVDQSGVITLFEGRGLEKLGLKTEDAVGRSIFDLYADEPRALEAIRRALAGEAFSEAIEVTGGTWWETFYAPLRDDDDALIGVGGVSTDVTERMQAECDLRESEERYRNLVELAPDAIVVDVEGKIAYANRAAAALLGLGGPRSLLGRPTWEFVPPDDLPWVREVTDKIHGGELIGTPFKARALRGDGTLRSVELSCIPIRYGGREALHVNIRDTTARNELEEQLRQGLRVEAVGQLAGGIAHGFNNVLTSIRGNADLLLDEVPQDHRLMDCLSEIQEGTNLAGELAQRLLVFSRRQVTSPVIVDLNMLAAETEKTLRRILPNAIDVQAVVHAGPVRVKGDPRQLKHVLLNLALNSGDAMPKGGRLTFTVSRRRLDEEEATKLLSGKAAAYAVLEVTDTGTGITEADRQRLFEPFFTTKDPDQGLGLGLATVQAIVAQCGGGLQIESEVGAGTTVRVFLPSVDTGATEDETDGAAQPTGLEGSETVLVVEDDAGVRGLVVHVLERYGYHVLEASRPGDALLLCVGEQNPIHLMVVDLVMPLMNGRELAERATALHPEMAVIYMSGYTDDPELAPDQTFLKKPFSSKELMRIVREALGAKSDS